MIIFLAWLFIGCMVANVPPDWKHSTLPHIHDLSSIDWKYLGVSGQALSLIPAEQTKTEDKKH